MKRSDGVVIAFAGNPNVGKTAILNSITGASLQVGNWTGVTVEKKTASFSRNGRHVTCVDIPGVYAMTPYSLEEKVARDYLIEETPDVIINVVDVTNLERNLILTLQLMELHIPMVIALNMMDDLERMGGNVDYDLLARETGLAVIPTVGRTGRGTEELIDAALKSFDDGTAPRSISYKHMTDMMVETELEAVERDLEKQDIGGYPLHWLAVKMIEKDAETIERLKAIGVGDSYEANRERIESYHKQPVFDVLSDIRTGYASGITRSVLVMNSRVRQFTDVLDSVVLNKYLGIPVFFFFMYIMFKFTFEGSAPFVDWMGGFFTDFVGKWLGTALTGAPVWIHSLLIDGVLGGVGAVLSFVPLMAFLYFFLGILEESGYMSRAAFVMDRLMRAVGLPGKAFVPLLVGFGCNVPAIYASRTLEDPRDRKITALLTPFMSCAARLPVYALFTAVFFAAQRTLVIFILYMTGVFVAALTGIVFKRFLRKGEDIPLIMELPPYRFPTAKMLGRTVYNKTKSFVRKAGTVILFTMIILWALTNLPYGSPPEDTLLAKSAGLIAPVFKPNGFGKTGPVAALIPGIVAKEVVVGALGQLYGERDAGRPGRSETGFFKDLWTQAAGLGTAAVDSFRSVFTSYSLATFDMSYEEDRSLSEGLKKDFTPLSAMSYLIFVLLFVPCVAVLAAIYHEFGLRMLGYVIALTLLVPWVVSALFYNIGLIAGFQ